MNKPDLRDPVQLLAFGFGSGLAPKAPGTAGSFLALFFFPFFMLMPVWAFALIILIGAIAGGPICGHAAKKLNVHDDGRIVWDEFIGQWIALLPLPLWWRHTATPDSLSIAVWVLVSFALFRLFDVWKPWPIRALDRGVHGGVGIMLDDIVAGIFAACVLLFALSVSAGYIFHA